MTDSNLGRGAALGRYRSGLRAFVALALAGMSAGELAAQARDAEFIIRNGLVVTVEGRMEADIRIHGERIAEIGPNLSASPGVREIEARGMILMPDAVDTHTHLNTAMPDPPQPFRNQDDYESGSAAAFAGGVTTVSNFITIRPDEDVADYTRRVRGAIARSAMADVFLHVNMGSDPAPFTLQRLEDLVAEGFVSTGEDFMAREPFDRHSLGWYRAFRASGAAGVLSMMHAEDYPILTEARERLMAEGRGSIHNFAQSAPVVAEVVAVQRAVAIAEATGSPMYILHMSSGRALRVAEDAMARGLPVYVETRPMYLHLTAEVYQRADAGLYLGGPPLRGKWDQDMLWEGIAKGTVHTIGTDHTGYSKEAKLDPTQDLANKRLGLSNLQEYLPMLFSEGVNQGRITLEQFVAVTSTNAAKLFGFHPRKGEIRVGSDADIVVWDPTLTQTIRDEDQLSRAGYSTYADWEVTGFPVTTIRRGEVVYDNGQILSESGSGQFIPGAAFKNPQLRPMSVRD